MSNSNRVGKFFEDAPIPVIIALILFVFAQVATILPGMLEQGACTRETAVKRIEVLFPGYRIGRWLMKPIHSCVNECAK